MRVFKLTAAALTALIVCFSLGASAQRKMEWLNRGLVAVKVTNGVFLSWRVLGNDPKDVAFNIYRNGTKLNTAPITGASNMVDAAGTSTASYTVTSIIAGVEQSDATNASVWATQVKEITLEHRPSTSHAPNDINVGDLDGDGQYELVVKWYPANAQDNSIDGVTDNTFLAAYKLDGTFMWILDLGENIRSGAHYTQHLVADFDGDGKAEVICKTAPRSKDASGNYLSKGPAASGDTKLYRDATSGHVSAGPEYLTIFNGKTGLEMATVTFLVGMGVTDSWGKTGDNTNRVHRFNSTIAYLDGNKPSAVFNRGYYGRLTLSAWDWDGKTLSNRWIFNSSDAGNSAAAGQGNHNLSCGDVDGDGFDELILGACGIDHNGKLMYATGLGHGDAMHLGDLDLDNPGLEVWEVHEGDKSEELHDAKTGTILWKNGNFTADNGRGLAADIDASSAGCEMWSAKGSGTMSSKNTLISSTKPAMNFRVYWDGDLQDELLDSKSDNTDARIDKWNGNGSTRLITLTGLTCNGTKATPNLSADILGDWREEVILHDGASKLYIHTTTIPTSYKLYTPMHDPVYRNAISWQQSSYNQPPHLGFFLGNGVDKAPIPSITITNPNPIIKDCNGDVNGKAYLDDCSICVGGNTGKTACVKDCNGDPNGTASLDACGICSGGKTNVEPCTGIIQAEDFCQATGVAEATNAGFLGTGYLNFNNEINAAGSWKLSAESAITAKLSIRYANGATTARSMNVSVNGTQQTTFAGETTSNWTTYNTEIISCKLTQGSNTITFTSSTADGGPNIDALILQNTQIKALDCNANTPSRTITLHTGWNLIGYPYTQSADVAQALSSIWPKLEVVKNLDYFYIVAGTPAFNLLKSLDWGQGYWVKVNADCTITW